MQLIDLAVVNRAATHQAAILLVTGFAEHWPDAWPDLDAAARYVGECLADDRICRAAVSDDGELIGWTAAEPLYGGNVWELNVIVVQPSRQRQGIGRALLEDMECQVAQRGGLTIWLGSDDEDGMTSLAGVDLYPDPAVAPGAHHQLQGASVRVLPEDGIYRRRGSSGCQRARQAGYLPRQIGGAAVIYAKLW